MSGPSPAPSPWSIMRGLLRRHRRTYAWGAFWLLLTNALGMSVPWLLGRTISALASGGAGLAAGRRLALTMAGVALAAAVVRVLSRLCILGGARRVELELKNDVFAALVALPRSYHDRRPLGDLISRAANDVRMVRALLGPGALYSINIVFLYAIGFTLTASIDWQLTLLAFGPFPLLVLAIRRLSRALHRHSRDAQERLATLTGRVQENLAGMFVVRSYAAHDRERRRFDVASRDYLSSHLAIAKVRGVIVPMISIGTGIGTLIIVYAGGARVIDGRLALGQFVAFMAYLAMLVWPTYAMGWVLNILQRARPALERVCELLAETSDVADPADPVRLSDPAGQLEIRGLTWGYGPGQREPALSDVSLTIQPGERLALVGRVGAGKSTLLALLTRTYPLPDGALLLDGTDINRLALADLRRAIAVVPQDAFLFSRPVDDNIAYGRPGAARPEVELAAGRVRIDEEIAGFEKGYDTWVGERGVTLSGGQRQRMTMARALLVEPVVLVLDDATASLDARTEQDILAELFALRAGKTTILVTHRVATMRLCDRVAVLDRGRLEAAGPFADALGRSPTLAAMVQREQLEDALESYR